ncbi:MAG: hypothetical protein ABI720_13675 [Actinomycetes bacterium]
MTNHVLLRRAAWWAVVVVTVLAGVVTLLLPQTFSSPELVIISFYLFALVGAIVALKRPENPVGWIFLMIGLMTSLASMAEAGRAGALEAGSPFPWWGVLATWYNSWFWYPLFMLATTFTFLLFPTGLASRRWRPVLWVAVGATVLATVMTAIAPTMELAVDPVTDEPIMITNPMSPGFASDTPGGSEPWPVTLLLWIGLLCGLAAVVSVVLRTWRSRGVERLQMRLFAAAIVLVSLVLLITELVWPNDSVVADLVFALALAGIPLACGVAVLRYHLYDIDRVLTRTTAYLVVTAFVVGVYAIVVTVIGQLLPKTGGSLAVAAATLTAAALFRPVLVRVRRLVDRRFNREQFDADRVVEEFAYWLRHEVDRERVAVRLQAVLSETVQPSVSAVWIRETS